MKQKANTKHSHSYVDAYDYHFSRTMMKLCLMYSVKYEERQDGEIPKMVQTCLDMRKYIECLSP